MSTRSWLGMSWWNAALALAVLAGAVTMAALGQWPVAAVLVAVLVFVVASAVYARSGRASDLTRLNALEYADERDRTAATRGFAVAGAVGLVLALVAFVLGVVLLEPGHPMFWVVWAQVIVLTVVWGVANVVALRRS